MIAANIVQSSFWPLYLRCVFLLLLFVTNECNGNAAPSEGPNEWRHDATTPTAFEYETMPFPPPWLPVHSKDRYLLTRRLGTGKFSDVFEAVDLGPSYASLDVNDACFQNPPNPSQLVVIKCLKPIAERKIRRELYLLHCARNLPNILRLKAFIPDDATGACLVLQHAGTEWLGNLLDPPLTAYEIRYCAYQLLIAMQALHRAGIMHRDIKPRNVLLQRRLGSDGPKVTLIDLGLADVYQVGRAYNVRVASRHYKAPELLLGDTHYHGPAVDVWAFGCLLASLLSRREPFFRGRDLDDQLVAIQNVLGTGADWQQWLAQGYGGRVAAALRGLADRPRRAFRGVTDPIGDDLLQHILVYDPAVRYTTEQIMAHAFFDPVRERCQKELSLYMLQVRFVFGLGNVSREKDDGPQKQHWIDRTESSCVESMVALIFSSNIIGTFALYFSTILITCFLGSPGQGCGSVSRGRSGLESIIPVFRALSVYGRWW